MINFPAIYIANGMASLLSLVILFSFKRSMRHGLFELKVFHSMIVLNIIQCFIETAGFLLDGKTGYGYRALSMGLSTVLFINSSVFAFLWAVYSDYKLFTDMERIRRIYPFVAIPSALIIIGCLINLATPVFFIIDANNIYQRTNLFFIPYIVTYFYVAYGVIIIYSFRNKVGKNLFLPAIMFMTPIVLGSLLQFFFYGYSFMWLGTAIGMISLFINVQNEATYIDVLSGLFNRQYLNNILSMYDFKRYSAGIPAGIMLDIDSFKNINDRFGHVVGDDAIASAGKILRSVVGNKEVLCRYGGDEFIILMHIKSHKNITDIIDNIKTQTILFNETNEKPYNLDFSIGYGTYDKKHGSIDDFLKKIDDSMYENKNRKIRERLICDRRQI
ncbi:MAG: diguanylate cyclase [Ruminococcaceae bacterium]|nr:diguanylate cyclase [Oscillospiraceae bacterium]